MVRKELSTFLPYVLIPSRVPTHPNELFHFAPKFRNRLPIQMSGDLLFQPMARRRRLGALHPRPRRSIHFAVMLVSSRRGKFQIFAYAGYTLSTAMATVSRPLGECVCALVRRQGFCEGFEAASVIDLDR